MKKGRKRLVIRGLAVFLIFTIVFTYWASALISIKIADDSSNVAQSYLAKNTEYVNESRAARTWALLKSLKGANDPGGSYLNASIKIGQGEYEEALIYINKCLEYWSADKDQDMFISLMTKKGCLLTLLGNNAEAVQTLEKVTELTDTQSDVYMVLAQIYYEQNDVDSLETALKHYVRLVPDDTDMRVSYSQTLLAKGKLDEAKEELKFIIDSKADEVTKNDAYHSVALIAIEQQDFTEAKKMLEMVRSKDDVYKDIHYDLAVCDMATGELEEAIAEFTESINLQYNVQYCSYSRAVCELARDDGNYTQAYLDLQNAVSYQGDDKDDETAKLADELLANAFIAN